MEWYWLVLIILGVCLLAGLGLLSTQLRRRPPAPPQAPVEVRPAPPEAVPREAPVEEEVAPAAPVIELERPEPTAGRLVRLRARLSRSQNALGRGLLAVLSRDRLDDDAWEEVEDTLITADVGVEPTRQIVDRLRERTRVLGTRSPDELRTLLKEELVAALDPKMDRTLAATPHDGRP